MQDEDSEIRACLERDGAYWIDASILEDLEKGRACDYGQRTAAKMLRSRGDWIVHAESEIARLRTVVEGWQHSARNAERDIAQLREERDGARAEVCLLRTGPTAVSDTVNQSMADYAESRGWHDLFRENTDGK